MSNDTTTNTEDLLTLHQVATRLGLTAAAREGERQIKDPIRCVKRMIYRHELRGIKVGRYTMVDPRSIRRFIDGQTVNDGEVG